MPKPKNWPSPEPDVSPVMRYVVPERVGQDGPVIDVTRQLEIAMHEPALTLKLYRPDGRCYWLDVAEFPPGSGPTGDNIHRFYISVDCGDEEGMEIHPVRAEVSGHTKREGSHSWESDHASIKSFNGLDRILMGTNLTLEFDPKEKNNGQGKEKQGPGEAEGASESTATAKEG